MMASLKEPSELKILLTIEKETRAKYPKWTTRNKMTIAPDSLKAMADVLFEN